MKLAQEMLRHSGVSRSLFILVICVTPLILQHFVQVGENFVEDRSVSFEGLFFELERENGSAKCRMSQYLEILSDSVYGRVNLSYKTWNLLTNFLLGELSLYLIVFEWKIITPWTLCDADDASISVAVLWKRVGYFIRRYSLHHTYSFETQ